MLLDIDFRFYSKHWVNTRQYNDALYRYFEKRVDEIPYLKKHYDVIFQNELGFGEKAFRYFWQLVFSQMPVVGKFLEIGVYKGSILALSQLIARELGIELNSYGVTPLGPVGDKYSTYADADYMSEIKRTFGLLDLDTNGRITIMRGLSTDANIAARIVSNGPFDVIYIDGGHDYQTVVNDLKLADSALKTGGFLTMDDCSCYLNVSTFAGHLDVSDAARDFFTANADYRHLFACGHNRVWIKEGRCQNR